MLGDGNVYLEMEVFLEIAVLMTCEITEEGVDRWEDAGPAWGISVPGGVWAPWVESAGKTEETARDVDRKPGRCGTPRVKRSQDLMKEWLLSSVECYRNIKEDENKKVSNGLGARKSSVAFVREFSVANIVA